MTEKIRNPNVSIIDLNFPMPQLMRTRRIWAYLPPDYHSSGKKYPVLYAHDGQNLFDTDTSYAGEWGIDAILDSLHASGHPGVIVIGIDNGGDTRNTEYNPYDNEVYGRGEGEQYSAFVVESLKPFVDEHLRTLPDRENTGIAGSSMGGLISFYIWIRYPQIFGKVGIFSPSFWIAPKLKDEIRLNDHHRKDKIFLIAGDQESERMIPDMEEIYSRLLQEGMPEKNMQKATVEGAGHCEAYWHQEFAGVFLWLFRKAE